MKRCLLTLVLGAVGALTLRAETVTQITGGYIIRDYVYSGVHWVGENDDLFLTGSTGGTDFKMLFRIMDDAYVGADTGSFLDHITGTAVFCTTEPICFNSLPGGAFILDVQTFRQNQFPFRGVFSASGSFVGPGVNVLLAGSGTTRAGFTDLFDPDPGYYFTVTDYVRYDFAPVPEPATVLTTGLGLLAVTLLNRRRISRESQLAHCARPRR